MSVTPSKALRLLSLLPTHPVEFYDRVMTVVEVKKERGISSTKTCEFMSVMDALSAALNVSQDDIAKILAEKDLAAIEKAVSERIAEASAEDSFNRNHNGDFALARSIYVICRLRMPDVVLETGVANGVSSAFALQALAVNRKGRLFSIDFPPLGKEADQHVGALVPQHLRGRWKLYLGPTKRVLPDILASIGELDVFIHDSLHTFRNMTFEFESVWPRLRPGGILLSDDVGMNDAFADFAATAKPLMPTFIQEENKDAQFGIMVKAA
ncbi:MAG TPA: class I SAM-dependent methyltransferase [Acidisarcina sp.]|nr:class I SAM-dependent methyltransferase [Acidisarcina sp.]